jgi:uncharacterized protein with PQ loop repeat
MQRAVELIEQQLSSLVGISCAKSLVALDYENLPCIKLAISKLLGLGIIFGSSILKVPQILKIVKLKSAQGISLTSYVLETVGFMIALAYNYRQENPFSTYGEGTYYSLSSLVDTFFYISVNYFLVFNFLRSLYYYPKLACYCFITLLFKNIYF